METILERPMTTNFGPDIKLSRDGNTIIVGDPNFNSMSNGAVFIFKYNGSWDNGIQLSPSTSIENFGNRVDINQNGTIAIVSNPGNSTLNAIVFRFDGINWDSGTVINSTRSPSLVFGTDVSISSSGNTIFVSSISNLNDTPGYASIYRYDTDNDIWNIDDIFESPLATINFYGINIDMTCINVII
jgi:hypothetical protein